METSTLPLPELWSTVMPFGSKAVRGPMSSKLMVQVTARHPTQLPGPFIKMQATLPAAMPRITTTRCRHDPSGGRTARSLSSKVPFATIRTTISTFQKSPVRRWHHSSHDFEVVDTHCQSRLPILLFMTSSQMPMRCGKKPEGGRGIWHLRSRWVLTTCTCTCDSLYSFRITFSFKTFRLIGQHLWDG